MYFFKKKNLKQHYLKKTQFFHWLDFDEALDEVVIELTYRVEPS